MSGIVELRENIKRIYAEYDAYLNPVLKFLLALIVFGVINGKIGYMSRIDSFLVVVVVALLCSFLPLTLMAVIAGLFILAHMYALAMECALVGAVILFLMFLLYIRFVPTETIVILITPILFMLKIPYVIPIALGLFGTPVSIISAAFGVVLAYLIQYINANAETIATIDDGNMVSRIRLLIDGLLGNKSMYVVIVAFAVTIVVVYMIRTRSIDYSWTIAVASGAVIDALILMIGGFAVDADYSIIGVILGGIVAALVGIILQLFSFHLDYKSTENLQFEDEEYYYYVKAVPKIVAEAPVRRKRSSASSAPRSSSHSQSRNVTREKVHSQSSGRSVAGSAQRSSRDQVAGGQSRTVHTANGASRTIKNRVDN